KYGLISDEKFAEKANEFVLLKNTEGQYFTLDEYKEKIKETQTDKYERVVALYTPSPDLHASYIGQAREMGYDVLLLNQILDTHFLQHLEHKADKWTFVRVDSDTPDHLIQKDEKKESVLSEKEQEKVKAPSAALPGLKDHQVTHRPMSPGPLPVVVTRPELMPRLPEMQMLSRTGGLDAGVDPRQVIVNSHPPLLAEKLV